MPQSWPSCSKKDHNQPTHSPTEAAAHYLRSTPPLTPSVAWARPAQAGARPLLPLARRQQGWVSGGGIDATAEAQGACPTTLVVRGAGWRAGWRAGGRALRWLHLVRSPAPDQTHRKLNQAVLTLQLRAAALGGLGVIAGLAGSHRRLWPAIKCVGKSVEVMLQIWVGRLAPETPNGSRVWAA